MNLVLALFHSRGMTREQIRSSVVGYSDAASEAAFARKFERDKDLLRSLGVPLITLDPTGHPQDISYRIDRAAYALPPVEFTPAELGALTLAGQLWQESAPGQGSVIGADAKSALTKLRGATAAQSSRGRRAADNLALSPKAPDAGPAYPALLQATRDRARVSFAYHSLHRAAGADRTAGADHAARTRTVEPWRLGLRGAGWYLVGRDLDADAPRVFRLSRIAGGVRVISPPDAFVPPPVVDLDTALGRRTQPTELAHLAVRPQRGAALRARAVAADSTQPPTATRPVPAGFEEVVVPYDDEAIFAEDVASYGADVVALGPAPLVTAVVARLQAAARLGGHDG